MREKERQKSMNNKNSKDGKIREERKEEVKSEDEEGRN